MQFLKGQLGVNAEGKDTAQVLNEIGKAFARMPVWVANAYAKVLGINENTMLAMRRGMGEYFSTYQDILKKVGVNEQAAADAAHKFMVQLRTTVALVEVFSDKVVQLVAGKAGDYLARFRRAVEDNFGKISEITSNAILWILRVADVVSTFTVRGVQFFSDLYDAFKRLPPVIQTIIEVITALSAALWLLGPTKLIVSALALGLLALYDDYKTWKEGGKHLIDWQTWQNDYDKAKPILEKLGKEFTDNLLEHWKLFSTGFKVYMHAIVDAATWAQHELTTIFDKFKEFEAWLNGTWIGRWIKRREEALASRPGTDWRNTGMGFGQGQAGEDQDAQPDAYGNPQLPGPSQWPSTDAPREGMKIKDWAQIVKNVIGIESKGNPNAYNKTSGASGMMQLLPGTYNDMKNKLGLGNDIFNAADNIKAGVEYLREMTMRYGGDVAKGLAAYNWGPGHLDKDLRDNGANWMHHLPNETANYLVKAGAASPADVSIEQTNNYHIHGDTGSIKHAVTTAQTTTNAQLTRNLRTATQ
jgi:hypothetical protein